MKITTLAILIPLTACVQFNADTEETGLLNYNVVKKYKNEKNETVFDISKIRDFGEGAGHDGQWGTEDDDVLYRVHVTSSSEVLDTFSSFDRVVDSPYGRVLVTAASNLNFIPGYIVDLIDVNPIFTLLDMAMQLYGFNDSKIIEQLGGKKRILSYAGSLNSYKIDNLSQGNIYAYLHYYVDIVETGTITSYIVKSSGKDNQWFTEDDVIVKWIEEDTEAKALTIIDAYGKDGIWKTSDDIIWSKSINYKNLDQIASLTKLTHERSLLTYGFVEVFDKYSELFSGNYRVEVRSRYSQTEGETTSKLIYQLIAIYDTSLLFENWKSPITVIEAFPNNEGDLIYTSKLDFSVLENTANALNGFASEYGSIDCPFSEEPNIECLLKTLSSAKKSTKLELKAIDKNTIELRVSYSEYYNSTPGFPLYNYYKNFSFDNEDYTSKTWLIIDETK